MATDGSGSAARWGFGSWSERGSVPAGPGWESGGAYLGPSAGGMAAHEGWGARNGGKAAGFEGVVGGCVNGVGHPLCWLFGQGCGGAFAAVEGPMGFDFDSAGFAGEPVAVAAP